MNAAQVDEKIKLKPRLIVRNRSRKNLLNFLPGGDQGVEQSNSEDVSRRYPREVLWDPQDPRLLVVQASPLAADLVQDKSHIKKPTPKGTG